MRPKEDLTRKGKQYLRAIQECMSRYEVMPTFERTLLLRGLDEAAKELDGRYLRRMVAWQEDEAKPR